ncbi:MAG: transcription antitermination factor NusB [Deltaproteobacteria bacterium]|nr:transcription antitermination factor NusB [Deltaproteobacteria bacterium]
MNSRRKARETALKILYNMEMSEGDTDGIMEAQLDLLMSGSEERNYAEQLVQGALSSASAIDGVIEKFSDNWTLDRMPIVDRCILRIAVYELKHRADVPYRVVIDEAVEIAKLYGSDEAPAFVNAVLDKAHKGGN